MSDQSQNTAQEAFLRSVTRQLSPFVRDMFTSFAERHEQDVYNCYLVMRFKSADNPDDKDNQLMEMRAYGRKDLIEDQYADAINDVNGSDMELIRTLLPMFRGDLEGHAQYLSVPLTHMYLRIRLLQNPGGDKSDVTLKCASRKDYSVSVFSDKI